MLFICLVVVGALQLDYKKKAKKKDAEIVDLKDYKHTSDSLHLYKDERLKNYLTVTLGQNVIIDKRPSAKREKESNDSLMTASSKL